MRNYLAARIDAFMNPEIAVQFYLVVGVSTVLLSLVAALAELPLFQFVIGMILFALSTPFWVPEVVQWFALRENVLTRLHAAMQSWLL